VSKGRRDNNICGIRLDCGSEISQEYGVKYNRAFKECSLSEIHNQTMPRNPSNLLFMGFLLENPCVLGLFIGLGTRKIVKKRINPTF
jgi:hypothetical protein